MALCWAVYFGLFVRSLRGSFSAQESDSSSWGGMILQFAAVGVLLALARPSRGGSALAESILRACGLAIALSAILLTRSALRHLRDQWSLKARLRHQHRLVTDGPYARVRHPLYLAFFLLTAGTGIALSTPLGMLLALPLSLTGAFIRLRAEDRMLQASFGEEFKEYAQRVPALIPRFGGFSNG